MYDSGIYTWFSTWMRTFTIAKKGSDDYGLDEDAIFQKWCGNGEEDGVFGEKIHNFLKWKMIVKRKKEKWRMRLYLESDGRGYSFLSSLENKSVSTL